MWDSTARSRGPRLDEADRSLGLRRAEIRDIELEIALPVPGVLLERERHVECGTMGSDEGFAIRGAPGDAPHDLPLLAERHLEMPLFQDSRTVHDLDPACAKYRLRVAGAKGRQR